MLAPIFPRPTNPSFMTAPFVLPRRALPDRGRERGELRRRVRSERDRERPALPRSERREVPRRLRRDDPIETVRSARNRHPLPRRFRDLEEDPGGRAALVKLPRGVEESRAEPDRRRHSFAVP